MIEEAKKELKKIEYKYKKYSNKFTRQKYVFEDIALKIDSNSGDKKKLFIEVRKLYSKKMTY